MFSSVEKVRSLLSSHIKIHEHNCFGLFLTKRCLISTLLSPDSDENTFSLEKAILEDSYFSWKQFKIKKVLIYLFIRSHQLMDWSCVDKTFSRFSFLDELFL